MKSLIFNVAFLSIIIYNAKVFGCTNDPVVDTQGGKVKGAKQISSEGDEYCSFKGVPYAKPPVGKLRFSDPEPLEPWTGIRDATAHGPSCAQHDLVTNRLVGEEDCLYLNVYAKSIEPGVRHPVMFWIHGGGFVLGNGDDSYYGPDYFMTKNVVLVTINYRLGVFGFLCLNDESAPGNQGLKDQLIALEWVRDNIANFGGDPNSVTIFGESAGSASVHYLALSPLAKGLFHKAILQSGVVINPWAFQMKPEKIVSQLCNHLGYEEQNPKFTVEYLRSMDAKKILKARKELRTKEEKLQFDFVFVPCIDTKSKNPIIPVHPEIAAAEGIQVPSIIGHNSREGLVFAKEFKGSYDRFNNEFDQLLHPNIPDLIKRYGLTPEILKNMYFKNDSIRSENGEILMDLWGDVLFIEGIHHILKTQVEKGRVPTYFYQFSYDKQLSFVKIALGTKLNGACHVDDIFFLYKANALNGKMKFPEKGSEKYRITEQMIELWVNFATTGVPTPLPSELIPFHWQPVTNETVFARLYISENLRMDTRINLGQNYTTHRLIER